jgi:hypothetical protein
MLAKKRPKTLDKKNKKRPLKKLLVVLGHKLREKNYELKLRYR